MQIAYEILKQLPPGLTRIAVVGALAVLFFLPELRRKFTWQLREEDRLGRAQKAVGAAQVGDSGRGFEVRAPASKK